MQGGKPGPPSLQKYLIECALSERTGLNLDDLYERPYQEAVDYVTITGLLVEEQSRRERQQRAEAERKRR